ncbi:hypothetical protein KXR64_20480 [Brucella intermedia]|uniref:hypothetical protein n=1 Tax=Brucella TaxID=234 RepID=UPI0009464887|nr:hypothetical protein [Brucella intermedia]
MSKSQQGAGGLRFLSIILVWGWAALLIGFMELNHEFERIGPETTLVTNHFTGDVKYCRVYRSGDMSCHSSDIEPRHWLFALIPLWPGRDELNEDPPSELVARETPFTMTSLFKELLIDGIVVAVLLVVTVLILSGMREGGTGSSDGGGSDGGGGGFGGK